MNADRLAGHASGGARPADYAGAGVRGAPNTGTAEVSLPLHRRPGVVFHEQGLAERRHPFPVAVDRGLAVGVLLIPEDDGIAVRHDKGLLPIGDTLTPSARQRLGSALRISR